jgi:uncharacterized protein (UPF0276 family)
MSRSSIAAPIPAQAGIGLRLPHHAQVLAERPAAAWLEVHPENYMSDQHSLAELELIRGHYPLSLHAVGLSLGSAQGVDVAHIGRLRQLVEILSPGLVSDHLSWSVADGRYLPDLLPLPYTEEALSVVCRNVSQVQEALGRQILVENPSTYLCYASSTIPEAEFLAALAQRSGCGVLFDVNNVYVSAANQRLDPATVLEGWRRALDARTVGEIHLAGHALVQTAAGDELRIDDHGDHVCTEVWALYERALAWLGPKPTLLEWDTRLPAFGVLQAECALAQSRLDASQVAAARHRSYARAV